MAKTIKEAMTNAHRQLADAAKENMQPDPNTPPKMGFPFDLQTRKPVGSGKISGSVPSPRRR